MATGKVRFKRSAGQAAALVQKANFHFLGAFHLPQGAQGASGDKYTDNVSQPIAYDPIDGKLYACGRGWATGNLNRVSKLTIPDYTTDTDGNPCTTATVSSKIRVASAPVEDFVDITEGTLDDYTGYQAGDEIAPGGLLVIGGRLYMTQYVVYSGEGLQDQETWSHDRTLATAGHLGPYHIFDGVHRSGFVSGAMCEVPSAWQTALGGTVISSQGGISIISRTSAGPNAHSWNHNDFASITNATALLYYVNGTHPFKDETGTAYDYDTWTVRGPVFPWQESNGVYWNGSELRRAGANAIPNGFRSYLMFCTLGKGYAEYGLGEGLNGGANASNPPSPPVDYTGGANGGGAVANGTTSSDGLRVFVPNADVNAIVLGEMEVWIPSQTTPVMNATANNCVRAGCSPSVAVGNSGTAGAYIDVQNAFAGNLGSQTVRWGKRREYDPNRGDDTPTGGAQGNHAWPYMHACYAYDLNDLAAVKAGTKNAWDVVPYGLFDLDSFMPQGYDTYGQVYGGSLDLANNRMFLSIIAQTGGYKTIVVLGVS